MRRSLIVTLLAGLIAVPGAGAQTQAPAGSGTAGAKIVNLWQPGDPGQRLYVYGQVRDTEGRPVAGAIVSIRQADGNGEYHDDRYRAALTTAKDGGYRFGTVLPGQYGSVKHIHVYVTHDDYAPLATEIVFKGDAALDEATQREEGVFLEESRAKDETILHGRFDIVLTR